MYEFPKPGPEQERLSKLAGEWKSEVKFYVEPGAPPMVKPGAHSARMDVGGYFLLREFRVDLDDAGDFKALAFDGRGLTGYDPFQRKYIGVWVDSGSPALYQTEASFDALGDVYTETSRGPGPSGEPLVIRMVTTFRARDEMVLEMFRVGEDGSETLVTEIRNVRVS
ncbi:DUF1579 family protein [Sorangium sp. So ce341]|uniref:DUF1579 family protein n=1 Tax=Sorangium sp. So ce341 TaxID=3133302 RepID=UPI003F645EB0